jgi:hypothetical protein
MTKGKESAGGLIDTLLILLEQPVTDAMWEDVNREGPLWAQHRASVGACLDVIVPALQRVVTLGAANPHGINCIYKPDVEEALGKVPLKRTKRGWT